MKTPLDGIRVIDWTIWQQGPFATALLGDLGAEVIKLETLDGDPGRAIFAVSGATTARNARIFTSSPTTATRRASRST
jgi:crotonobetainyl-CoA:carnitine CoA-transferase CaiB-like acyl-CoA transferase